jgi:hypothetical protein
LRRKSAAGRSVDNEVRYAAIHFDELDREELKGLEVSLLERIVSSPRLRVESEDSLLDLICSLDCEGEIVLLRYLRTEYMSSDGMAVLLARLPDINLDGFLWASLSRRLCLPLLEEAVETESRIEPQSKGARSFE